MTPSPPRRRRPAGRPASQPSGRLWPRPPQRRRNPARGIRAGTRVKQGQIIGYVGATGLASGPHLHYEFLVNSRFVNPLQIQVPRERQLTGRQLAEFQKERARVDELMRRAPVMTASR